MKRTASLAGMAVLVLAGLGLIQGCGGSETGPPAYPGASVLIISIDTLRADRLGTYGYDRPTSPRLDEFAKECVQFDEVYSTSPKTAEAHMSLFTSMPVSAHGVSNTSARLQIPITVLAKNRLTLTQVLRRAEYWTAGVACGGNVLPQMGFARGFVGRFNSMLEDITLLIKRFTDALEVGVQLGDPMFLFLHTYQVHGPYLPPREYREKFAPGFRGLVGKRVEELEKLDFRSSWSKMTREFWVDQPNFGPEDAAYLSDLYDAEIAYTDHELGKLLDQLRDDDLLDDMIVVITSDHGEEFAEHGDYQHDQLYREHLHVPLLIRLPDGRFGGTKVKGLASLIDVMPTLLELVEIEGPPTMMGRSLIPAMMSGRTEDVPILSERTMFADDYLASLRTATSHVMYRPKTDSLELYDVAADPDMMDDLGASAPFCKPATDLMLEQLSAVFVLRAELDAVEATGTATLTPEQIEALTELAYTEGSSPDVPEGTPLEMWPGAPCEQP
ncbi:MAG: sulfatase [Planctomycetota bacterium]|jgi:arylsulfatase A-like enzyme